MVIDAVTDSVMEKVTPQGNKKDSDKVNQSSSNVRKLTYAHPMTEIFSPLSPGRRPKRVRSDAEIREAAERFAADWVAGDSVQTWLNWHEGRCGELSEMILRGWSWADISRALFKAGICYRTGRPIPVGALRVKTCKARAKNRRGPEAGAPTAAQPVLSLTRLEHTTGQHAAPGSLGEEERPVFRLVRAREDYLPADGDAFAAERKEPTVPVAVTADEIHRRIFGKTAKP